MRRWVGSDQASLFVGLVGARCHCVNSTPIRLCDYLLTYTCVRVHACGVHLQLGTFPREIA